MRRGTKTKKQFIPRQAKEGGEAFKKERRKVGSFFSRDEDQTGSEKIRCSSREKWEDWESMNKNSPERMQQVWIMGGESNLQKGWKLSRS